MKLKKFWNIFLLVTTVISILLTAWIYYLLENRISPIAYDATLDKTNLNICNKDKIQQYYHIHTDYLGGKRAIKNELLPQIEDKKITFENQNGYITIRFIVTCNGEIGLFRANTINEKKEAITFDNSKIAYLKDIVSGLKNWDIKPRKDKTYDSYYFVNFKVKNGLITDIF